MRSAGQRGAPVHLPGTPFEMQPLGVEDVLQPSPFTDKYAITHPMTAANTRQVLAEAVQGLEHVAVKPGTTQLWGAAPNGTLFSMSIRAGEIVESSLTAEFSVSPGRVLGFTWDSDGGMYICNLEQVRAAERVGVATWSAATIASDPGLCFGRRLGLSAQSAVQGLMYRSAAGALSVVVTAVSNTSGLHPSKRLAIPNSVAVSPVTGKVYFTDSTDSTTGSDVSVARSSQLTVLLVCPPPLVSVPVSHTLCTSLSP